MSNWNHSSHKKIVLVVISYREMFALLLNKCVHRSLLKIQDNWLLLHLRQHLLSLLLLRFCFWTKLTLLLPRTDQSRVLFISYPIFPQAHNTTCTWVYVHTYTALVCQSSYVTDKQRVSWKYAKSEWFVVVNCGKCFPRHIDLLFRLFTRPPLISRQIINFMISVTLLFISRKSTL